MAMHKKEAAAAAARDSFVTGKTLAGGWLCIDRQLCTPLWSIGLVLPPETSCCLDAWLTFTDLNGRSSMM
jgi:hypothetical protein